MVRKEEGAEGKKEQKEGRKVPEVCRVSVASFLLTFFASFPPSFLPSFLPSLLLSLWSQLFPER
jgi:hypothetical protein